MNVLKRVAKVAATGIAGTAAGVGLGTSWLVASTTLVTPIPRDDPLWNSATLKKLNILENPVLADICIKRIPLSKIRPELLQDEAKLTTEFARGVWTGWAFEPQRWLFTKIFRTPENSHLKFSRREIAESTFEIGTEFIDQFQVVEWSKNEITMREGVRHATRRRGKWTAGELELTLSTRFFKGRENVTDGSMPVPYLIERLHYLYARALVQSGSSALR
ncbi:hypothetical protein PG999_000143 [Apiospora kogelbergensis]|uniref:Coenzyme Q-binding protein COQ10 START domain-containing protein n=1 Tax=Apiospora kogelbergensis TaxID=1337665 RepID=A0AAW0RAP7_9PEZI